nr:MAG TPA: hypothetical protein [Caudoviricetes sp.]
MKLIILSSRGYRDRVSAIHLLKVWLIKMFIS